MTLVKGLGLGGVERLLSQSIPYLDRDRFDYEICYFTPWKNDVAPEFEAAGIDVFCLGIRHDARPDAVFKVRRFLSDREYDVIHTHSPFPSVIARVAAPKRGLAGLVHTEHSLPGSRNPITRIANRLTYPACDVVISVSRAVQDAVQGGRVLAPGATRLIYGGIDGDRLDRITHEDAALARRSLGVPDDHSIVGNIAHLRRQKGLEVWLDTARIVLEARPLTTFVLVGREKEPGYQARLEERAARLGISDRVRFAGFQPEPYPYVAAFDVFLMSSNYEGFPVALVEAMALGVPIVSTDVGGVAEALGEDPVGLLAEAGDSSTLARHVTDLLGDDRQRAGLGARARARARGEFTVRGMVEAVEDVYESLLAG